MGSCTSENTIIREYSLSFANKQDPALDRPFARGASLGEIYGSTGVPSGSPRRQLKEGPQAQCLVLGPLGQRPRSSSAGTSQGLASLLALASCVPSWFIYCVCFLFWLAWSSARQGARRLTSQGLSSRRETWQKAHFTESSGGKSGGEGVSMGKELGSSIRHQDPRRRACAPSQVFSALQGPQAPLSLPNVGLNLEFHLRPGRVSNCLPPKPGDPAPPLWALISTRSLRLSDGASALHLSVLSPIYPLSAQPGGPAPPSSSPHPLANPDPLRALAVPWGAGPTWAPGEVLGKSPGGWEPPRAQRLEGVQPGEGEAQQHFGGRTAAQGPGLAVTDLLPCVSSG